MPLTEVESSPGHKVYRRTCDGCGSPAAPFGMGSYRGDPSKVKCWCGPYGCTEKSEKAA